MGYVYLVQEDRDAYENNNWFKFGMSAKDDESRLSKYGKTKNLISKYNCDDPKSVEDQISYLFNDRLADKNGVIAKKRNEYFKTTCELVAITIFWQGIFRYHGLQVDDNIIKYFKNWQDDISFGGEKKLIIPSYYNQDGGILYIGEIQNNGNNIFINTVQYNLSDCSDNDREFYCNLYAGDGFKHMNEYDLLSSSFLNYVISCKKGINCYDSSITCVKQDITINTIFGNSFYANINGNIIHGNSQEISVQQVVLFKGNFNITTKNTVINDNIVAML